jgi:hypothetical protein
MNMLVMGNKYYSCPSHRVHEHVRDIGEAFYFCLVLCYDKDSTYQTINPENDMTWHRTKGTRKRGSRPLGDYDNLPARPVEPVEAPVDVMPAPDVINYPVAIDPETGHVETIGKGRIAVLGATGVEQLVMLPKDDTLIDVAVAAGDLTYGA